MSEIREPIEKEHKVDFIVDIDTDTESRLSEFGLKVVGSRVICSKKGGAEWEDDFGTEIPEFGRKEFKGNSASVSLTGAIVKNKPIGYSHYQNVESIKLRYVEGSKRNNMMGEYSHSPYIDYQIITVNNKENRYYHLELDGMRHVKHPSI